MYAFTSSGGNFTKVAEGLGLDAAWNKDGTGVVVSTVSGGGQIQPLKYIDIKSSADVIRPVILSDDSFIAFQDKTTGFLWSMKLK
ncbi:MAG: hypothetical protein Q8P07_04900 [bacterium]|nr:hypothetical protein [bacterium]